MPHKKTKRKKPTFVKFGKPIVHIPYRFIRFIATLTVIYHICTLAYNAEMINIALHIKGHIGDYLNIIFEGGYTMVVVLFVSSIIGIIINVCITVILLKIFSHIGKIFFWLLFASMLVTVIFMIFIICMIIFMFLYAFTINTDGIENFYVHMQNYSTNGLTKARIDIMQIEMQCCGARNYTDWYDLEWYDTNFIKTSETEMKLVGETPFSCCNIQSMFPCIHHGIESGTDAYNYDIKENFSLNIEGCWAAIENRKTKSGLSVAGYLALQLLLVAVGFIPLRLLQTASNEERGFNSETHVYVGWLWGCYVKNKPRDRETPAPDYHPLEPVD